MKKLTEKYRLNKEDVCLLVIDVQEKLVPIMKHGKAIIKNTQILLQGAKEMGIPVIATEQYPKGLGSTVADLRAFLKMKMFLQKIALPPILRM